MSKKKNTLSDLEAFLKLQASSLVTPVSLSEKVKKEDGVTGPPISENKPASVEGQSEEDIIKAVKQIGLADKKEFYDFIVKVTKDLPNYSAQDALLINTALYLKGGSNWQEVVKAYWKKNSKLSPSN